MDGIIPERGSANRMTEPQERCVLTMSQLDVKAYRRRSDTNNSNDKYAEFLLSVPCRPQPSTTPFVPGINTKLPPSALPLTADADEEAAAAFAWCFSRQYDSLILVSGILL